MADAETAQCCAWGQLDRLTINSTTVVATTIRKRKPTSRFIYAEGFPKRSLACVGVFLGVRGGRNSKIKNALLKVKTLTLAPSSVSTCPSLWPEQLPCGENSSSQRESAFLVEEACARKGKAAERVGGVRWRKAARI